MRKRRTFARPWAWAEAAITRDGVDRRVAGRKPIRLCYFRSAAFTRNAGKLTVPSRPGAHSRTRGCRAADTA